MATTKRKLNTAIVAKEGKALSLVAEKRLKEKGRRLSHNEVWSVSSKRI